MPEVRAEDWPYGLRCGECSRLLKDGDRYAKRWTGMADDLPVAMIIGICCAEPADAVDE